MNKVVKSKEGLLAILNNNFIGRTMFITNKVNKRNSNQQKVVTQSFIIMSLAFDTDPDTSSPDILLSLYNRKTNKAAKERASNLFLTGAVVTFNEELSLKQHEKMDGFLKYSRVLNDIESFQQDQGVEPDNDFIEHNMRKEFSNIMAGE